MPDKLIPGEKKTAVYKKQKFGTPFVMKGNPMQRNFGIVSPVKTRQTKSTKRSYDEAFAHNALPPSDDHYGSPHGPKPGSESPLTQKTHPVTPPTEEERRK